MTVNIVCSSKPCDGLLYYSYEYCAYLNKAGIKAKTIVICHRSFTPADYISSVKEKYVHCENVVFEYEHFDNSDVTLVMGRSMITLSWQDFESYAKKQQDSLKKLFCNKVIAVYSENHPEKYPKAIAFYNPKQLINLCDLEVYPNGIGEHFEKTIYFDIHKEPKIDIQFEYLFLGTNARYYETVQNFITEYPDHGIITYDEDYVDKKNNNIFAPVTNLLGKFNTFVYTKSTFDPAPRIVQECKYFNKNAIYMRDKSLQDGGSVYWQRSIDKPNIEPIVKAFEDFK